MLNQYAGHRTSLPGVVEDLGGRGGEFVEDDREFYVLFVSSA